MFKQNFLTKKTGFLLLIIAGLFLTNINFAEAVAWKTITDLPGLPAGSEVTLSDFIIVLYNFMLSAVGIAAMFMIVVGGFRYLTAAGNAASLSEAKDIIYSALYGLLLALSTWVIVSTINPDLLYLKQPGADPVHQDYRCLSPGTACVAGDNCCYKNCGDIIPAECPKWTGCTDMAVGTPDTDGNCTCLDKEKVPVIGNDCNETCRTEGHCGWNFLVVRVNTDGETKETVAGDSYHKLDPDKSQLWDFFLTNNGRWDDFMIPSDVDSYTVGGTTYECAILVTARRSVVITLPIIGDLNVTGDYRNIFWVKQGTVLHKDAFSLEEDLCGKFVQCCQKDFTAGANDDACKVKRGLVGFPIIPGCDKEFDDPNDCSLHKNTVGSEDILEYKGAGKLFKTKYTDDIQDRCGNENIGEDNEHSCSLAASYTEYRPNRDIICDPDTGMWR